MFIWFTMMGVLGVAFVFQMPSVIKALNPYYGVMLLIQSPKALVILGAVFLCTTGAEALYSDLGHCGRKNIQISWIYVKSCLVLNYLGQAVWLLQHNGKSMNLNIHNPFYEIMPGWFLLYGIGIATIAAIIASQALISGSFTLIARGGAFKFMAQSKDQLSYRAKRPALCTEC